MTRSAFGDLGTFAAECLAASRRAVEEIAANRRGIDVRLLDPSGNGRHR